MTPVDLLADNDALKEENERLNTAYYALAEENERLRAALGAALDKDEATRVLKHRIGELKTRIDAALNVATVALLIPHYAYGDSEGGVALADALRATVRALKGRGVMSYCEGCATKEAAFSHNPVPCPYCRIAELLEENKNKDKRLSACGVLVSDLRQENERLRASFNGLNQDFADRGDRIDAALALHKRGMNPQNQLYCMECRRIGWPCPTVKALKGE